MALRLADGLGYTSAFPATAGAPIAHHPPGWVTVLGVVSWLGARSTARRTSWSASRSGSASSSLTGLVGRRYFNARVGVVAALIAAAVPGLLGARGQRALRAARARSSSGVLTLVVATSASARRSAAVVRRRRDRGLARPDARPEQLALLVIVVVPILLGARASVDAWQRSRSHRGARSRLRCGDPAVDDLQQHPLRGARRCCRPTAASLLLHRQLPARAPYGGKHLGWYDNDLLDRRHRWAQHPGLDRSQLDPIYREQAIAEHPDHLDEMPVVVPAPLRTPARRLSSRRRPSSASPTG